MEHNPFKEWERVELKPSGHLAHRNAYTNLERVGWELDDHQVGTTLLRNERNNENLVVTRKIIMFIQI